VERGGKRVLTFAEGDSLMPTAAALAERGGTARRQAISTIDGVPAQETPLGRALLECGYVASYKGITRR